VLNVYSGECHPANVAVKGRRIAYVGAGRGMVGPETRVVPLAGALLAPGYVEPHTHTGMATPEEFAREVLRTGTTAVAADTLQLLLHTPADRIPGLLTRLADLPVLIVWCLRLHAAGPSPDETPFALDRLRPLLDHEAVRVAGEVTRWPAVYRGDQDLLAKMEAALAAGRRIEGHAPGASADRLAALAAAGWSSDHEAITAEEAAGRLRAGLYTMLRHSSLRPDLPALAAAATAGRGASGRLMLTADGPEPAAIAEQGYLSHVIRQAIASGIPPVRAYQMATINPAAYLGLDEEIGGIAPGRRADIVVLEDLRDPAPRLVLARGAVLVEDGEVCAAFPAVDWGATLAPRFAPSWAPRPGMFDVPVHSGAAAEAAAAPAEARALFPVIHLENSVITRRRDLEVAVERGRLRPPDGVLRAALLDPAGRWIVRGLVANFADRLGGLASTFNVTAQLLVLGQDGGDMAQAARRALELGGGIVAVEQGRIALEIALPLGGTMAYRPLRAIAAEARTLYAFLRARGYPHADPHYTLLFLPLDSLPDVRITYAGIWDVRRGRALAPREDL
jgi:adenine deaminase